MRGKEPNMLDVAAKTFWTLGRGTTLPYVSPHSKKAEREKGQDSGYILVASPQQPCHVCRLNHAWQARLTTDCIWRELVGLTTVTSFIGLEIKLRSGMPHHDV